MGAGVKIGFRNEGRNNELILYCHNCPSFLKKTWARIRR